MTLPTCLLVPTDFSDAADRALDAAIKMADEFDAELILLHVYTQPTALYGGALFWPNDEYRRAAAEALDAVVSGARARYPKVWGELVEGEPRAKILEVAEARGADLIVIGTQGRRGFAHALLGSVAEGVLRRARVPVLTVSAGAMRRAERRETAPTADAPAG
jgi:nucleotide-binding universal stress UspA family protein